MSRERKQLITNLYIKDKDIKRLSNGYTVFKRANKHAHALIPRQKVIADRAEAINKAIQAKITKLQAKLLKPMPLARLITAKRKYTIRNTEYWAKKSADMKVNSPLIKYHAK